MVLNTPQNIFKDNSASVHLIIIRKVSSNRQLLPKAGNLFYVCIIAELRLSGSLSPIDLHLRLGFLDCYRMVRFTYRDKVIANFKSGACIRDYKHFLIVSYELNNFSTQSVSPFCNFHSNWFKVVYYLTFVWSSCIADNTSDTSVFSCEDFIKISSVIS